jgi:choline dehydrogenase-like flavoprotein
MSAHDGVDRSPSADVDVCIVGTGVAGALVGLRLAEAGRSVVFLEAGERFEGSRLERMEFAIRSDTPDTEVWEMGGPRDRYTTGGAFEYPVNSARVKGVGGTTLHWQGNTPRFHEVDFELGTRHGLGVDWPISYDDLSPYYTAAERELGVAGSPGPDDPPREADYPLPAFPKRYSDGLLIAACERLGISTRDAPQARNSVPYDGRSACLGFATCLPVCPSGAKYSADATVRKAEAAGARVIDHARVVRLDHDETGRIVAARYVTPDGAEHRQEARHFVLAAGAVETPRLLLLSASDAHPDGLANSSGAVGRYLMEHPVVGTVGRTDGPLDPEPIGFLTTTSEAFYGYERGPGSFVLEFRSTPRSPLDDALGGSANDAIGDLTAPARWGDALLARDFTNREVSVNAQVEMLPRAENRVTLDPSETDDLGNPVPNVSLSLSDHEREAFRFAFEVQADILAELGSTPVRQTDPERPAWAHHLMGTARMGGDPATSVVDARLRSHDHPNLSVVGASVFPTGAAANPVLTISALALRAAEDIGAGL